MPVGVDSLSRQVIDQNLRVIRVGKIALLQNTMSDVINHGGGLRFVAHTYHLSEFGITGKGGAMAIDSERHSRVIAMLREEKLDALTCSAPTQVLWLTGYWPVIGNSIAIFTVDGEVHVLLPEDEHEIAANSSNAVLTDSRRSAVLGDWRMPEQNLGLKGRNLTGLN